ncbi:aminotransferase class V-fold PLP-dependent enzyme [Streptomyces sp. NPDC050856]|uniref:aminotransferase class V-fold PLP-dependent enzyme n=1 Tax=Streptomyces sp. NPDC050856 TaxID=3154939 RepID=UPI0033C906E8
METSLAGAEFAPAQTYLNTATCGLLPRRAVTAVKELAEWNAQGRPGGVGSLEVVAAARARYARIAGVGPDRVAVGGSVAVHAGLIAGSLPAGAEVLLAEGDFSSLLTPFAARGHLTTRYAPLEELAGAVRPGTALVAVSAVQSADGRVADLAAVREAAAGHGARLLVDTTQAVGWLPLDAGGYDYTVAGGYKYLCSPRGTSFLTVTEEAQESLPPLHAGWIAAEDLNGAPYGAVRSFAAAARRYDEPPAFLAYHGAERSLAVIEEVGVEAIHAHDTALAARFRAGVAALGHEPVPGDSAVVAVPGLGGREGELLEAGVVTAARAGNLRVAFHLYNSVADVDRALDVLSSGPAGR